MLFNGLLAHKPERGVGQNYPGDGDSGPAAINDMRKAVAQFHGDGKLIRGLNRLAMRFASMNTCRLLMEAKQKGILVGSYLAEIRILMSTPE